jgi:hypothetical protein
MQKQKQQLCHDQESFDGMLQDFNNFRKALRVGEDQTTWKIMMSIRKLKQI